MSFDIFLYCLQKGEPRSFKRDIVDEIFLPYCNDPEGYRTDPKFMQVEYPDGGGSDIYLGRERDIAHMMFNHCGGDAFFQAMYALADRTSSVIFWPNVPSLVVVTNEAVLKELDPDFPGIDNPRIVHSGADIVEAIRTC